MAEIPEHLLKRAQEAKARATTGGDSSPTEATASESKIPEELLNRTAAAGSQPSARSCLRLPDRPAPEYFPMHRFHRQWRAYPPLPLRESNRVSLSGRYHR